jgi:membrane protease subunit HflK
MPWNSNEEGPWGSSGNGSSNNGGSSGSNNRNPWNNKNMDDIVKNAKDKVFSFLPGGKKGILLILIAVLAIWMISGFYTVGPEEQGVVLRFGKYIETTSSGLNYHLPTPIEKVIVVPVTTTRNIEIGFRKGADRGGQINTRNLDDESLMLTGDENIVDVNFVVQWYVGNAADYLFNVRSPAQNIKDGAESVMREIMGRTEIEFALSEGREQIRQEAQQMLQEMLDSYKAGIIITSLLMQRVDPPATVIDDYRDVQRARADRERLINESEAYANRIVPEARGEASKILADANGYKEQVIARAEGAAQRFISIYNEYAKAKEVTKRRIYLETMEQVMQNTKKIIIDNNAGSGVVPYLPLPELKSRSESNASNGESR